MAGSQSAESVIADLDTSIYDVTVNVRAGTYAAGLVLMTVVGAGQVTFAGDETTPSNVTISVSSACVTSTAVGTVFNLRGFKFASSAGSDVQIGSACRVNLRNNEYAGTAAYRIAGSGFAYITSAGANNKIRGGGSYFVFMQGFAFFQDWSSSTYTITANVTFSTFAHAYAFGRISTVGITFSLGAFTVTGQRHLSQLNSVIDTNGGGASTFPGTTAGSTATGGQFS